MPPLSSRDRFSAIQRALPVTAGALATAALLALLPLLSTAAGLLRQDDAKRLRNAADGSPARDTRKRVALVVGCAGYRQADPLRNTLNDADDVAAVLRGSGFEVLLVKEPTKQQLIEAIARFGAKLTPDAVALFYYSGHGAQINGRNYLIPVDFAAGSEAQAGFDAVEADRVLAEMDAAKSSLNVVILDACRDNPFAKSWRGAKSGGRGSAGLTQMEAPRGTLLAYATAPGRTASDNGEGRNGLYTQELLKAMRTPGMKLQDVFEHAKVAVDEVSRGQQEPWTQSGPLKGAFYFLPSSTAGTAASSAGALPPIASPPTSFPAKDILAPGGMQPTRPVLPANAGIAESEESSSFIATSTKVTKSSSTQIVSSSSSSSATASSVLASSNSKFRAEPDYLKAVKAVTEADWSTAGRLLPAYAEKGDAWAQSRLGAMIQNGSGGVSRDEAEAAKWFRKAADQGEPLAQRSLGVMYENGRGGLRKDAREAAGWYAKAGQQGDAAAQSALGRMYELGLGGLPKDPLQALRWYARAATQGDAGAKDALGRLAAKAPE